MAHPILSSLPALLLPLGLFTPSAHAGGSYLRSYASARAEDRHAFNPWQPPRAAGKPPTSAALIAIDDADGTELTVTAGQSARELVIIDSAVPDKAVFYRGVKPGVEIVEIDASRPGLAQLKQALASYRGLSALHIVSHAEEGVLHLGSSRVDAQALQHDMDTFAALNDALAEGADLMLYGCDLANTVKGEELLDIIIKNSHLDIAASNNTTGNIEQGGDWDLEIQRGAIETKRAFSEAALKDFTGVLQAVTFQKSSWTVVTPGQMDKRFAANGINDASAPTIDTQVSQGGRTLTVDGAYNSTGITSGGIYIGRSERAVTLSFTDGSEFKPSSIEIYAYHGDSATITTNNGGSIDLEIQNSSQVGYTTQILDLSSLPAGATSLTITNNSWAPFVVNGNSGFFGEIRKITFSSVGTVNSEPTDIALSNQTVSQSGGANAVVGTLSTTDADVGNTHTYTLVSGVGDTDNASFNISGSALRATNAAVLAAGTYSVRIRTTDNGSSWFEEAFTVEVVDDVAPGISIGTDKTSLKAGETATLSFTLSDPSSNFAAGDIAVTGGALSGFAGSGASYTATFTPNTNSTTTATVNVGAGTFTDAAGNNNTAATQVTIAVDTQLPTISIGTDKTSLKAGEAATLTFTLSEAASNFTAGDIAVTGGSLSGFAGSGASYTATFTPNTDSTTTATVNVGAGTFTDAAGNNNTAATQVTIAVDTQLPTLSIGTDKTSLKAGEAATLTFTLNKASSDFAAGDIAVTGGALSGFAGSGASYTATFTPNTNSTTAATVNVGASTFTDAAGNNNTAATQVTIAVDTQLPTISIGTDKTSLKAGEAATLTFTLSEPSSNFTAGDITVAGGALSGFTGSGANYTATFTPTPNVTLTATFDVGAAMFTDAAGNSNTAAAQVSIAVDTQAPTVTIGSDKTSLRGTQTAALTFTLSEASSNFTAGDITVTGGTLSGFAGSGTSYTALFRPSANSTATATVNVGAATFTNAGGNDNTAATQVTITVSTVPPTIGGTPPSAVARAQAYSFTPTASSPEGDPLTFSIVNQPVWASFDPATGTLSGTPTLAHVGTTTSGIVISVSDGWLTASLTPFSIAVTEHPAVPPSGGWGGLGDNDADGIPDAVETLVPSVDGVSRGDGNGDGTPDVDQDHVTSIPWAQSPSGQLSFVTLSNASGLAQTGVSTTLPAAGDLPANLSMPYGLLSFEVNGVAPLGGAVSFSVYVDANAPVDGYYKKSSASGNWENIATGITTVGARKRIDFTLTDGDPFDTDGLANGRIVDPGGPGMMGAAAALTPIPLLSPWAMAALAALMAGGAGVAGGRRRRR